MVVNNFAMTAQNFTEVQLKKRREKNQPFGLCPTFRTGAAWKCSLQQKIKNPSIKKPEYTLRYTYKFVEFYKHLQSLLPTREERKLDCRKINFLNKNLRRKISELFSFLINMNSNVNAVFNGI